LWGLTSWSVAGNLLENGMPKAEQAIRIPGGMNEAPDTEGQTFLAEIPTIQRREMT